MYNILTRETSIVSITLLGSIFRMNENTESLISARISCSLEAPAFMTAAKTCKSTITPIKHLKTYPKQPYMFDGKQNLLQYFVFMYYIKGYSIKKIINPVAVPASEACWRHQQWLQDLHTVPDQNH